MDGRTDVRTVTNSSVRIYIFAAATAAAKKHSFQCFYTKLQHSFIPPVPDDSDSAEYQEMNNGNFHLLCEFDASICKLDRSDFLRAWCFDESNNGKPFGQCARYTGISNVILYLYL